MKTIFKYTLSIKEKQIIELPHNAEIIRVEDVDGLFFLWAIVENDENHPKESRYLEFYKTGQPMVEPINELKYLGCCKLFIQQELCLYVFERRSHNLYDI